MDFAQPFSLQVWYRILGFDLWLWLSKPWNPTISWYLGLGKSGGVGGLACGTWEDMALLCWGLS